jgi:hypothetical protein
MNSKRLLIGLTGRNGKQVIERIKDADKFGIITAALFLEMVSKRGRKKIYKALIKSRIKYLPLVHIRNGMSKKELEFLEKNYESKCFTIHENSFKYLKKWNGFHKKLYLEMNYDDKIEKNVDVEKIGGFCVDLSHFKSAKERNAKEYDYVMKRKNKKEMFLGNHLNGYSENEKKDIHTINNTKEFNYLLTLPKFVFGKYIALEMFNSVEHQIKYKKYLTKFLKNKLK